MCELDRRTFLRFGLGATAAASLAPSLMAQDSARKASAKAVIVLFMHGGPSHIDTFDPKPGKETGGPFKEIDTAVRGVRICEHLPRLAGEMKHLSILRSVHSKEGDHSRGRYFLHTGHRPEPAVTHPGVGSYVSHEVGDPKASLPNFITVGLAGYSPAFLRTRHAAYRVDQAGKPPVNVRYAPGVNARRFKDRTNLLGMLEDAFEREHATDYVQGRRQAYRKAIAMMHTPDLRAFDLDEEDGKLRKRYGRNAFGQACLLARRLVERGVKFVEVGLSGWDTHADNFNRTAKQMEMLDPGFATLVRDLRERDMLKETLVLWMGEFGRTPQINRNEGRDHWPKCFSVVMGGGGIQGGLVIGSSDARGYEVQERPVSVQDVFSTVYRCLGIDTSKQFRNKAGRPVRILNEGAPVKEVF